MYRNLVKLPLGLIHNAHEKGWLLSLSYFVSFKSLHKNNEIYNYSSRVLASKLNLSPTTVNFHVKKLIEKGLAKMVGKNLVFLGEQKLVRLAAERKLWVYMIKVPVVNRDRETTLKAFIVYNNIRQQEYCIKRREKIKHLKRISETSAYISKSDAKKLLKLSKKEQKPETRRDYTSISCVGIATLTNNHPCTAYSMRKKWVKLGLITSKRRSEFIKQGVTHLEYRYFKKLSSPSEYNKLFYSNGSIMKSVPNEISFIDRSDISGLNSRYVKIGQA